jgi:GAF domain-containing protein
MVKEATRPTRGVTDVQPVLDTVVETAARLCSADSGSILIREGEVYRDVSSTFSAAEPEYWAILRQRTMVPGRDSVIGRAALEGRVVHVADILADPEFARPEVVAAGRRTVLGVPLLREGAVLRSVKLRVSDVLDVYEGLAPNQTIVVGSRCSP